MNIHKNHSSLQHHLQQQIYSSIKTTSEIFSSFMHLFLLRPNYFLTIIIKHGNRKHEISSTNVTSWNGYKQATSTGMMIMP